MNDRTPSYWLRQRAGDTETIRLNATEAALIAARPGAVGNYRSPAGLVWRERDPKARGGYVHFTLTPVFEGQQERALVVDVATERVGEVVDRFTKDGRPAVWLRPRGGGKEWTAFRSDLRLVKTETGVQP